MVVSNDAGSTITSILEGVTDQDSKLRKLHMERFAEQYSQPLVAYLCNVKRESEEAAYDLVQTFWLKKLVEPAPQDSLVAKYLRAKTTLGAEDNISFRAYLMRSIARFHIDHLRANKRTVSLEAMEGFDVESNQDQVEFDRLWANRILKDVVLSVRDECQHHQQHQMWQLFLRQILIPNLDGSDPPGYADLSRDLGYSDPRQAANAVRTVIRKFQSHMRRKIADYLPVTHKSHGEEAVEAELEEILKMLSRPGSLDRELFEGLVEHRQPVTSTNSSFVHNFSLVDHADHTFLSSPEQSLYRTPQDMQVRWEQLLSRDINEWLAIWSANDRIVGTHAFHDLAAGLELEENSLLIIRNTAKNAARRPEDEPLEVLSLIYQLAIASGWQHHGKLLSSDPMTKVQQRMQRFLDLPWLDNASRKTLKRFLKS